jgi:hypothetical protein
MNGPSVDISPVEIVSLVASSAATTAGSAFARW